MARPYQQPAPAAFPWRVLLYVLVIGYLLADLYLFRGPLYDRVHQGRPFTKEAADLARKHHWVATVNGTPLTRQQLDAATTLHLYRRGQSIDDLTPENLAITRMAVLKTLVENLLVTQHAAAQQFAAPEGETEQLVALFEARFPEAEARTARLQAQGLDPHSLQWLLRQQVVEEAWILERTSYAATVTDEEARQWFAQLHAAEPVKIPEVIRARQIFVSTVEDSSPARETLIRSIHAQLTGGTKNFEALAAEFSEDERTKHRGGDLGYFSRERMAEDFANPVFSMQSGQTSEPFRTSIGWHIVQVTERKPARECAFEDVRDEVIAALSSYKRHEAIGRLLEKMREAAVIQIFEENLRD